MYGSLNHILIRIETIITEHLQTKTLYFWISLSLLSMPSINLTFNFFPITFNFTTPSSFLPSSLWGSRSTFELGQCLPDIIFQWVSSFPSLWRAFSFWRSFLEIFDRLKVFEKMAEIRGITFGIWSWKLGEKSYNKQRTYFVKTFNIKINTKEEQVETWNLRESGFSVALLGFFSKKLPARSNFSGSTR